METATRTAAELEHDCAFARTRGGPQARTTLLHIGAQGTALLAGGDSPPEAPLWLAIGAKKTAEAFFRHEPPTPLDLESAIYASEDEISRAKARPAEGAALLTIDGGLLKLAAVGGSPAAGGRTMTRDAVEQMFQRLASASFGHPGALAGLPAGREAAAVLLILREIMHHLGYESITAVDAAEPTAGSEH